ncbi:MAG TPA: hypothetical protein VGB18_05605, partial [Candidatus Thermoplasmatota archaeon]
MSKLLVAAIMFGVAFAGCTAGQAADTPGTGPQPTSSVQAPGEVFEDAGALKGVVIDDQSAPVPGAIAGLKEQT